MESLITEPGPKNPLLFLSLSLVNRIPGYKPDEKETLNQLDCMQDLLNSVSSSLFRLETVLGSSAVAIDALMTISAIEAKKSVSVRISALECLLLLLSKMSSCGIASLIEVTPGILSKMVKLCSSRVDVEIEKVTHLSLQIIEIIVKCFWEGQEEWIPSVGNEDNFVLLRQKYRNNIEMAICALRPLIKCRDRIEFFKETILNIFMIHLKGHKDQVSNSFLKLYLLLSRTSKAADSTFELSSKKFIQFYNEEIVEWFDINSDSLSTIHEEILTEKLELIRSLVNLKNSESILLISDLFGIIKLVSGFKRISLNSGGEIVSIEYSNTSAFGIQNAFKSNKNNKMDVNLVPTIEFKRSLKLSKEFFSLVDDLFSEIIEKDSEAIESLILKFDDGQSDELEVVIQKIDMTSLYYAKRRSDYCPSIELLKYCLKYYERSISEGGANHELIHLITLKLLWATFDRKEVDFRPNLLTILSGMASEWIILKEVSTQILKGISKHFNETIRQLVGRNEIFLLDRLGIQLSLPSLYPKAPQIISCLVREILEPSTSLKFTDLLVKKVSDNLAIYQKHSGYCKDLIEVVYETVKNISKIEESIKFTDPKDFAFSRENEEDDDEDNINCDATITNVDVLNCQQMIIIDLLRIGINFILSDSKLIRSKSLNLIEISAINFLKYNHQTPEPSSLCQLIHVAWPNMISVLKDSTSKNESSTGQLDSLVIESFASCCKILFEKLPLFMRDRFVKDYWKSFLNTFDLKKRKLLMLTTLNSSVMKISDLLLEILNNGLVYCKPSTEICLEILECIKLLAAENGVKNPLLILETFEILSKLEPDIIWYFYFIELGEMTEILASSGELKSFNNLKKWKKYKIDPIIKDKLKEFIQ